jgi:hypothetical protein
MRPVQMLNQHRARPAVPRCTSSQQDMLQCLHISPHLVCCLSVLGAARGSRSPARHAESTVHNALASRWFWATASTPTPRGRQFFQHTTKPTTQGNTTRTMNTVHLNPSRHPRLRCAQPNKVTYKILPPLLCRQSTAEPHSVAFKAFPHPRGTAEHHSVAYLPPPMGYC